MSKEDRCPFHPEQQPVECTEKCGVPLCGKCTVLSPRDDRHATSLAESAQYDLPTCGQARMRAIARLAEDIDESCGADCSKDKKEEESLVDKFVGFFKGDKSDDEKAEEAESPAAGGGIKRSRETTGKKPEAKRADVKASPGAVDDVTEKLEKVKLSDKTTEMLDAEDESSVVEDAVEAAIAAGQVVADAASSAGEKVVDVVSGVAGASAAVAGSAVDIATTGATSAVDVASEVASGAAKTATETAGAVVDAVSGVVSKTAETTTEAVRSVVGGLSGLVEGGTPAAVRGEVGRTGHSFEEELEEEGFAPIGEAFAVVDGKTHMKPETKFRQRLFIF